MKIISWNVNGIRAVHKKGFLEFLQSQDPDVLCLQETKAHPEQIPPELLTPLGRTSYWSSAVRKGYSGTVTYVRQPVDHVDFGMGREKFDTEGRFVITTFNDVTIYNMYFPNGGSGPERHAFKQEFLHAMNEHWRARIQNGDKIIVVGDYNVAHLEQDVYDPVRLSKESGFLPEERKWMDAFLELGFVDTFRHFHPTEPRRFTWWSNVERGRVHNHGWRIDYICVTKNLLPQLKAAQILDQVEGSDHCPVVLEMNQ